MPLCIRTISNKFPPFVNTRKHVPKIDHRIPKHVKVSSFLDEFLNAPTTTSGATNFKDKRLELYIADSTYQNLVFPSLVAPRVSTKRSARRYINDVHFQHHETGKVRNIVGIVSRRKDDCTGYKIKNYVNWQEISLNHSNLSNGILANNTTNFSKLCDSQKKSNFIEYRILSTNEAANIANADESNAPDKEKNMSNEKLENVFNILSEDLPKLFVKSQNYSIYTPDIVFVNNIRGATTQGIVLYMSQITLIKAVGHTKYAYVRLEILKMTQHPEENTIKVRWRIKGVSMLRSLYLLFKLRSPSVEKALAASEAWHDGFSTFYVNDSGKVFKHIVDKVIPDEDVVHKEDSKVPIPTKLASLFSRLST